MIPECSLVCYLGSLATDVSQVISGDAGPKGVLTYVLAGVTLVVMIGSATWATLFVRLVHIVDHLLTFVFEISPSLYVPVLPCRCGIMASQSSRAVQPDMDSDFVN